MATILVDMDGVIANWGAQYDIDLGLEGRHAKGIPRTSEQRSFDLTKNRTREEQAIIKRLMDRPGFYADLEPIKGAVAALREMRESGHMVWICTSPWPSNRTCMQDKLDWVKLHLGDDWLSQVILVHDKTLHYGDILIDDRPDIKNADQAKWQQVLFDQPYNHEPDGPIMRPRIREWSEWRSVVEPLLDCLAAVAEANGREVRSVSATGGEKGTKPQRYDLVPVLPLDLLAELYANGAEKYAAHNWRRGYEWSKSYAAAMRHMTRFWAGENIDPEMGIPHPVAAVFHMFALTQFMEDFPQFDDRYMGNPVAASQVFRSTE
jgi:5'(3')-deoxyribonucleotidase